MRTKSKTKEIIILSYVNSFFDENYRSPSLREIEVSTKISRQTVQRYLKSLCEANELEYDGRTIITKHIKNKLSNALISVPLLGRIACGVFESQEEFVEDCVQLPVSFLGEGEFFALKTYGDSMINVGIEHGDLVIVKKQNFAQDNQIVVAIDECNQNTLKRLKYNGSRYYLHAENNKYKDIYPNELKIQGVAVKVIKNIE